MSAISTTLLSVGPKRLHPWGDRAWRVALTAQYCAGSSSDYWLVSPTDPPLNSVAGDSVKVPSPDHAGVLDSIVFLLSLHLGDDAIEGYLLDHHNIDISSGRRRAAEFWELTPETRLHLATALSQQVRLGITVLDDCSLVDPVIVQDLRGFGFDVDVFLLHDAQLVS